MKKCALRFNTVGEAAAQEESLMSFANLSMVDPETALRVHQASGERIFLQPKPLLEEDLNRPSLANLVQHDLSLAIKADVENRVEPVL